MLDVLIEGIWAICARPHSSVNTICSEDDYFGVALNLFVSVVASDREVKDEHYI